MSEENLISPKRIKNELHTDFVGQEIHHFKEITSTNDIAKELAINGAKEGTIVIAETQTRGRGRMTRKWVSPEGGIWFSIILRPRVEPKETIELNLRVATVAAKVINSLFKLRADVKWPNDITINGKKVCGILTEMDTRGDKVDFVVIGIGINANIDLNSFPKRLRNSLTSLRKELKKDVDRERLLTALLEEFEQYYKSTYIKNGGSAKCEKE